MYFNLCDIYIGLVLLIVLDYLQDYKMIALYTPQLVCGAEQGQQYIFVHVTYRFCHCTIHSGYVRHYQLTIQHI